MKRFAFYLTQIIICLLLAACAARKPLEKPPRARELVIPAGVDSLVAAVADSISDSLFVSIEREKEAEKQKKIAREKSDLSDTVWQFLEVMSDTSKKVSGEDSLKAIAQFNIGAKSLQKLVKLQREGLDEKAKVEVLNYLVEARDAFENAIRLNPFDLEAKSGLAFVYRSLAVRFSDENNYTKAIDVLEGLTRLEKGEHELYFRLGENYYALKKWRKALENFQTAEKTLVNTAFLRMPETEAMVDSFVLAPGDTTAMFHYIYYEADTQTKLHNADEAVESFRRALKYASTDEEKKAIRDYIDWINWDEGNITASERRDETLKLQGEKKYKEAARDFIDLLDILKTEKARDEVNWRISLLEFEFLNKQNQGIERLSNVVKKTKKLADGSPADSTYRRYFDAYGVMCFNMGLENLQKYRNRKTAYTYFLQGAEICSSVRAKTYLELAKLSKNDPKESIRKCNEALALESELNKDEKLQVYQLLINAYKRLGNPNKSRQYFLKWKQLQGEKL